MKKYYGNFINDLTNKKITLYTKKEYETFFSIKMKSWWNFSEEYFNSAKAYPYYVEANSKKRAKDILINKIEILCRNVITILSNDIEGVKSFLRNNIDNFDNKIKIVKFKGLYYENRYITMPKEAGFKKIVYYRTVYTIPDICIKDRNLEAISIDYHPATIEEYINLSSKENITKYAKRLYGGKKRLEGNIVAANKNIEKLQSNINTTKNNLILIEKEIEKIPAEIRLLYECNIK